MILFRVLMTDALTSKARPAAADQRAARSELAGVRSVVSLLARRVAKRRDIVLLVPMLVRRASGKKVCCFGCLCLLVQRVDCVGGSGASAACPNDFLNYARDS